MIAILNALKTIIALSRKDSYPKTGDSIENLKWEFTDTMKISFFATIYENELENRKFFDYKYGKLKNPT